MKREWPVGAVAAFFASLPLLILTILIIVKGLQA